MDSSREMWLIVNTTPSTSEESALCEEIDSYIQKNIARIQLHFFEQRDRIFEEFEELITEEYAGACLPSIYVGVQLEEAAHKRIRQLFAEMHDEIRQWELVGLYLYEAAEEYLSQKHAQE